MYEHLLVALDGTPHAERVLEHAEALARAFGSTVTLLRATISPETLLAETAGTGPGGGEMAGIVNPTPIIEMDREAAEDYLNGIANRLRTHNLTVNTEYPEGPAASEIVERATAIGASLIVMTTHGRSGLLRVFLGSVADEVVRHAPCPVLLVHATEADDPREMTERR